MTTGTPGFVGARLREAREVRNFSGVSLSELAEVSRQAIYEYESGRSTPSPDVLERIADAVKLPPHFFLLPERKYERGTVFYRSMSAATKGARARAERRFAWLRDIVQYLSEFVALPESNFPDLGLPADPLMLSNDDIENAAEAVRSHWRLGEGPISNTVLLLENQGAVIARDSLGAETLDSLSEFVSAEQRPYIIVGTDKGSAVRWRFDAAHELGHIILHGRVAPELLARPEHHKRIEEQAHRFAAAFLLPLAPFGEDLFGVNLDALRTIKPKWKTSISMMIIRARHAGLLSEDAERRLWINYNRRGWRRNEPYDDTMEAEEPRLLRRAFELVLQEGAQTPEDIVSHLGIPTWDVEALTGMPPGYLSEFARVQLIGPPAEPSVMRDPKATPAQVIQMPYRRRLQ